MKHPFLITRPNGYFYVAYHDKFTRKRKTITTGTKYKSLANLFLTKFVRNLKEENHIKEILFSDYGKLFIDLSSYDNTGTINNYRNVINQFNTYLGNRYLRQYSVVEIDKFLKYKSTTTSVHTANLFRRCLNTMFSKAVVWNYLNKNIICDCIKFKIPETNPLPMSKSEFKILMDSITLSLYKDIFLFAVLSGLRMSEIINLKPEHIIPEKKLIAVFSNSDNKTKSGKTRFVELHSALISVYNKYKHQEYLFVGNRDKKKLNKKWLIKTSKKLIKKSGINSKFSFHSFRATFGYWLLLENVNLKYISQQLGHSSITTTEKYYSKYITSEVTGWIDKIRI